MLQALRVHKMPEFGKAEGREEGGEEEGGGRGSFVQT